MQIFSRACFSFCGAASATLLAAACASVPTRRSEPAPTAAGATATLFEASVRVVADSAAAVAAAYSGAGPRVGARIAIDPAHLPALEMDSPAEWWRTAPAASPSERSMRTSVLEHRGIAAGSVGVFKDCPGALAPVADGRCPPAGTVLALIGQSARAGDSARVAVAWLTTDGRSQTALAAVLRFRRCGLAWCFVGKVDETVIE